MPFGILNDRENAVTVIMDAALSDDTIVGVHPNDTTASVWLSYRDLKQIITQYGNPFVLIDFSN